VGVTERWRHRARQLKAESYALYLAFRDPRVPWYARVLIFLVVAYTLSPIDLIPDVIPVLGYVDDLVIAPLGIALALRMVPAEVLAECRERAHTAVDRGEPIGRAAAAVTIALWVLTAVVVGVIVWWAIGD